MLLIPRSAMKSSAIKTFHRLCLLFIAVTLLLTAEKATAQETFAPLLTENTVLFIHVDFSKVDVDLLKTEAKKLGETLLTTLGFDARSQRETLRELDVELEKLDTMIRPNVELITKELGIQEIAWICDETLMINEHGVPFLITVPWKGKTDEDIKTLYLLLPEESFSLDFLPAGDLLIVYDASFLVADGVRLTHENIDKINEEAKRRRAERRQFLTEWAQNAAADNNSPILQTLQSLNKNDEIKAVVRIPQSMRQEIQSAPFPSDMPIQTRNLILFAASKIEWIAASVSVSELLAGTAPNDRRVATVKMPSEEDAKMFREMMVSAIDSMTVSGIEAMMASEIEERVKSESERESVATQLRGVLNVSPLVIEFLKGYWRTWLPDVEGDTLIFRMKHLKQHPLFLLFSRSCRIIGRLTTYCLKRSYVKFDHHRVFAKLAIGFYQTPKMPVFFEKLCDTGTKNRRIQLCCKSLFQNSL